MRKNLLKIIGSLIIIMFTGTAGYMLIEGWPVLDSLYMTVITLTTVGFMEVRNLSSAGRLFTIVLIISGFSAIIYGFGTITAFIVEGSLMDIFRRRKMEKKIKKLDNHCIICGAGEMGSHVAGEFYLTEKPFVLVEKDENEIKNLIETYGNDFLYINGNAETDKTLIDAGIEKAGGLITTFSSDKENLFVVLTARNLNKSIRIVSRCVEEESEHKLRAAGSDAVVSANLIGGMRLASEMLRPEVVSFLDIMLKSKDSVLRVEEAVVREGSYAEGKKFSEAEIPEKTGAAVIAVKEKSTGSYVYNPTRNFILSSGDVLIAIGKVEDIEKLRRYMSS